MALVASDKSTEAHSHPFFVFFPFHFFLFVLQYPTVHSREIKPNTRIQSTNQGGEPGSFSLPVCCITIPPKVQKQCSTLITMKALCTDGSHGNRVTKALPVANRPWQMRG